MNVRSTLDLDLTADEMQQSILLSYHHNCRTRLDDLPNKHHQVPWCSVELIKLRVNTRWLLVRDKMTGGWDSY